MVTVAVSVALTVTLNDTDMVPLAGSFTLKPTGVVDEVTVQAAVAGTVPHLAEAATKVVPAGAASDSVEVPVAVPWLVAVRV